MVIIIIIINEGGYMKKILILLAGMLAMFALLLQPGNAVTNNTTGATATAIVSETISVTLSGTLDFGSLNAGTNNNSLVTPLNISIDTITNVATNISQNGTTFSDGGNTFAINNLRYSNASAAPGLANSTTMAATFPLPPFTNWVNITKPSSNTYRDTYYWLSIPNGQVAGTYQASIYVNVTKYGG